MKEPRWPTEILRAEECWKYPEDLRWGPPISTHHVRVLCDDLVRIRMERANPLLSHSFEADRCFIVRGERFIVYVPTCLTAPGRGWNPTQIAAEVIEDRIGHGLLIRIDSAEHKIGKRYWGDLRTKAMRSLSQFPLSYDSRTGRQYGYVDWDEFRRELPKVEPAKCQDCGGKIYRSARGYQLEWWDAANPRTARCGVVPIDRWVRADWEEFSEEYGWSCSATCSLRIRRMRRLDCLRADKRDRDINQCNDLIRKAKSLLRKRRVPPLQTGVSVLVRT